MFRPKVVVCNTCRNMISYAENEAGQTVNCRFCGDPVRLPVSSGGASQPARKRARGPRLVGAFGIALAALLLLGLAGAACVIGLRGARGLPPAVTTLVPASLVVTEAPAPARARGVRATVAVTEVRHACPDIYQASLRRTSATETPVCWVKLMISNTGEKAIPFRSWRIFEAFGDAEKATLADSTGRSYGLVSFGVDTYPVGTRQQAELAPDETLTELVLFTCDTKPTDDLKLSLPCENLGGRGDLHFRIPRRMIQ